MNEEAMNRLERFLWEEGNIKEISKERSRASGWTKGVTIALLAGAFALLASRPWPPSFADARVESAAAKTAAARSTAEPGRESSAGQSGVAVRAHGVKIGERATD